MISPRCTHDIPLMYSWYPPDVLNIPHVLMVSPHMYHDIPRCTHGIPPMYSWYPPMYSWYPPDVLMVSPRCTEHTLYRVIILRRAEILQCGPNRMRNFSTISLNISSNKKRTSRSFSILFSFIGSLKKAL